MRVTSATVEEEHARLREREAVRALINDVRGRLGPLFDTAVEEVSTERYRREVDEVFADGDRAVNVAALAGILRQLDCEGDYPGFVVDEFLGRKLAATIAGGEPFALLAEATFHFADVHRHGANERHRGPDRSSSAEQDSAARPSGRGPGDDGERSDPRDRGEVAGADDLDAALAAGFQTRLPGWEWTETESPFAVEHDG